MPHEGLHYLCPDAGNETDEEVERAFQHSVQSISNAAVPSASVQLTAAVHDMDIDHLLQKLICGEIQYNPHDPNRCASGRKALDWPARLAQGLCLSCDGVLYELSSIMRHDID